jgi:hypothetical protein
MLKSENHLKGCENVGLFQVRDFLTDLAVREAVDKEEVADDTEEKGRVHSEKGERKGALVRRQLSSKITKRYSIFSSRRTRMKRLHVFLLLGIAAAFMVTAFKMMSPTATAEEDKDVAQTVKFLLGSPTDPEDRKAVEDFNEFIRMVTKLGLSRV